jgi:hypothetical protein
VGGASGDGDGGGDQDSDNGADWLHSTPLTRATLWVSRRTQTADAVPNRGAAPHDDRQLGMLGNVVATREHAEVKEPAWLGHWQVGGWGIAEQLVGFLS